MKTFDNDFYKELLRLRGKQINNNRRPQYFGHLTNDIIYKRLAPGVLDELRRKNPVLRTGRRATAHHQWLTRDAGHPKLREHVAKVTVLMKVSGDWLQFRRMLDKALPKYGENLELLFKEPV